MAITARRIDLRELTLARRRAVLGPTHPDTIGSMRNLANSYAAHGRDEDGARLEEEALALARVALGPDHPDTLMIRNNLALSYAALRRFEDALKLQQETLALVAAKLGPNHPDTHSSRINVAKALTDLEQYDDAVTLLRETLAGQQINPGPDHPHTLQTMYSLARNFHSLGQYDEALKFHAEALAGRRVKLGPGHRHTLYSMWAVAENLVKLGRGAEAVSVIDECLRLAAGQPKAEIFSDVADLRLRHFAKASDPAGCRATAEMWEAMRLDNARSHYAAACFRAVTAKILRTTDSSPAGAKAADAEADLAMDRLRRAVAAGFKDAELLARDKDLDVLRDRADFRSLAERLTPRSK